MTRPDLDAIRTRWTEGQLVNSDARKDVLALLAYIADLEARCGAYQLMSHKIAQALDTWKQEEVPDED